MDSETDFYDGCVELTPAASAAVGAASGVMAGAILEVASGGVATPVVPAAAATVGGMMQDNMENGGWAGTCAAFQSGLDAVHDQLSTPPPPEPPAPVYDAPTYHSFDLASASSPAFSSSPSYDGGSSTGDSGSSSGDGGGSFGSGD